MAEILFLVHRAPWPPDRGDRIRSWHIFEALVKLAPVHVAALADTAEDAAVAEAKLAPLCRSLCIEVRGVSRPVALASAVLRGEPVSNRLFRSAALTEHVGALLATGKVSHIVAFSGQMAQYLPAGFAGPVVMDFVDVDSAKFATYAEQDKRQPLHWVHAREARRLGAFEAKVARAVDASLFVSEAEATLFRDRTGAARVHVVGNGIDTARYDPQARFERIDDQNGALIVFTGQMDYRPNAEAVSWFAEAILPAIRARYPDAHFAIVGRHPTDQVKLLSRLPGVIVTGEVADVRGWLAAAHVVVAPLLIARGVQNKVLEAMAMARPLVASTAAAEGIDHGGTIRVGDTANAIADHVATLLDDPDAAGALGTAARAQVLNRYGWTARLAALDPILGHATGSVGAVPSFA